MSPLATLLVLSALTAPVDREEPVTLPFPLQRAATPSEPGTLELVPRTGVIAELYGLQRVVFPSVELPDGSHVVLDLRRLTVDARPFVDGHPLEAPWEGVALSVWMGELVGSPDSRVALAFSGFGCHGWLQREGELFHLTSRAGPDGDWSASRARWVDERLLADPDVQRAACALDDLPIAPGPASAAPSQPPPGPPPGSLLPGPPAPLSISSPSLYEASLAVETDHQYYLVFGDLNAAMVYATTLVTWVSYTFEQQVGTVLTVPYLNFYTTPLDPWVTPDTGGTCIDMIYEFQAAWTGNVPAGAELGLFLSGAPLGCGVAFIAGLCDPTRNFAVVGNQSGQVQFPVQPSNANIDYYGIAHELGHSFNAIHTHAYCPPIDRCATPGYFGPCQTQQVCSYPGTLMSYCHACGGFSNIEIAFHPRSASDMRAYVEAGCLPLHCPDPLTYCTAKANSLGCLPAIDVSGHPTLTGLDDFHVRAGNVINRKNGILFWGLSPTSVPFQGGLKCVQAPTRRTPLQGSGGNQTPPVDCSGSYDFWFSHGYLTGKGLAPGTSVYAQYWSRDPESSSTTGLTDAVSFVVCN